MIHEYALEPTAVDTWAELRFFLDQFGIEYGRLISRFPKYWSRLVIEACTESGVRRTRFVERLKNIDAKMLRSGRSYEPTMTWLENAERQHAGQPFHAIIATQNPNGIPEIIISDDLDENTPLWKVRREIRIARRARDLATQIAPIIRCSKEILLVDQNFLPTRDRYQKSIKSILDHGLRGKSSVNRLELHTQDHDDDHWEHHCITCLCALVPMGFSLQIFRWRRMPEGDMMHPRFVLTEVGGLSLDYGLDEGGVGETTKISLLDQQTYEEYWPDFQEATAAFDLVDIVEVIGTRRV